jgi:VCBS repeat-containing protein
MAPADTCLQQREYNTKIMVGGKQVNGYGTACLQPDGSWRYGAAQPETF